MNTIEDLHEAMQIVFTQMEAFRPRYFLVGAKVEKMLRKYRPNSNRCIKTFKLRKLSKKGK